MIFVSYFTDDLYRRFAARMVDSALALGLTAMAREEKSRGDWYANRQMMPRFILDRMSEYPNEDGYCWVDADAVFHARPDMLLDAGTFDIAGYVDRAANEVFWAVLYFRNTPKARQALEAWDRIVMKSPEIPTHRSYRDAMASVAGIEGQRLPVEYCCIRRHNPTVQPIIENLAISRLTPDQREALLA